ncbi:hypothetical protein IPM19_02570 [bacterium]|nr:MAG: hypothetical protein IPM19_02570 [bacterium]
MTTVKLRRIYIKENRTNSFRFRKKSSEVDAIPIGEPKIVVTRHVFKEGKNDRQLFNESLRKQLPNGANAFLVGGSIDGGVDKKTAVQFYRIRVIHAGSKKADHETK